MVEVFVSLISSETRVFTTVLPEGWDGEDNGDEKGKGTSGADNWVSAVFSISGVGLDKNVGVVE